MKTKNHVTIAGMSLLLTGILFSGGCKSPEILSPKPYIPAPAETLTPPAPATQDIQIDISNQQPLPETKPVQQTVKKPTEKIILPPVKEAPLKYTVKRNDSFWKIAWKYGVTKESLAAFNNLSLKKPLLIGQVLNIPPGGRLRSPEELKALSRKHKKTGKSARKKRHHYRRHRVTARQPIPKGGIYIVRPNDNPWTIARKFRVKTSALLEANGLTSHSVLQVGQKLVIPGGTNKPASVQTVPATTHSTNTANPTSAGSSTSTDDLLDTLNPEDNSGSKTSSQDTTATENNSTMSNSSTTILPSAPQTSVDTGSTAEDNNSLGLSDAGTVTVKKQTTVDEFAAAHNISADKLLQLNPDIPENRILSAGSTIIIPAKK